ncbi:MAG: integrin alpha, partial [Acidobacteria bacterium]|nr:integrin alpha [Acidobacteriota bacterium]
MKESNQANSGYGISISTAGDVNGDGYSDILIGANNYTLDQTREGAVFVHYGSQLGLSSSANWVAESNQTNSNFGFSVATAGDVNGDGFSDISVGAKNYSNGETNEGAVFVYNGSSAGLPSNYSWKAESNISGSRFGHSVSSAGDVNGDGFSDLIVGAPSYGNTELQEGAVYLYLGSESGLSSNYNWLGEINSQGALFGYSISGAGDINGDGYSDVVIGAIDYTDNLFSQGALFVSYGNEKRSKSINYLQLRPLNSSIIVPPLLTMSEDSLLLKFFGNTEFGKAMAKAQVEVKLMEKEFDCSDLYEGDWFDLSTTGVHFSENVNPLSKNSLHKWRARLKYHLKYGSPIHSRWFYLQSNGLNEADFRTGFGPPPDSDGDGYNDEIDCSPNNNTVWASPSEAINFFITKDATNNLLWSA